MTKINGATVKVEGKVYEIVVVDREFGENFCDFCSFINADRVSCNLNGDLRARCSNQIYVEVPE